MKPISCLLILSFLVVAGQLISQQLASGQALDDSLGGYLAGPLAGLLGWSIPTAGFLGLILYNARHWRQNVTEAVTVEAR